MENAQVTQNDWALYLETTTDEILRVSFKEVFLASLNRHAQDLDFAEAGALKRLAIAQFNHLDWQKLRDEKPSSFALAVAHIQMLVFAAIVKALLLPVRSDEMPPHLARHLSVGLFGSSLPLAHAETQVAQCAAVKQVMERLARENRPAHDTLCMKYYLGLSWDEISEQLGMSFQNARTLEKRGLKFLKNIIL